MQFLICICFLFSHMCIIVYIYQDVSIDFLHMYHITYIFGHLHFGMTHVHRLTRPGQGLRVPKDRDPRSLERTSEPGPWRFHLPPDLDPILGTQDPETNMFAPEKWMVGILVWLVVSNICYFHLYLGKVFNLTRGHYTVDGSEIRLTIWDGEKKTYKQMDQMGESSSLVVRRILSINISAPEKWMVGIRLFSFGARPIFRGYVCWFQGV